MPSSLGVASRGKVRAWRRSHLSASMGLVMGDEAVVVFMVMEGFLLTSAGLGSLRPRHHDLVCRADLITMWRRRRTPLSIHDWHHLNDTRF